MPDTVHKLALADPPQSKVLTWKVSSVIRKMKSLCINSMDKGWVGGNFDLRKQIPWKSQMKSDMWHEFKGH